MASTVSFSDGNYGIQAGIINGDVKATVYLPPKRQDTPPQPSIVIPFARDPDFIERGSAFHDVQQRCAKPGSRTALVGIGGVGKSQLAIEYAYRTHEQSPETWVFWVHASNAARFEQSFRDIANYINIPGRHEPQANIFELVHDWLYAPNKKWLLILDNIDDAQFLLQVPNSRQTSTAESATAARPLREYVSQCERGSVLITTRDRGVALKLVDQCDTVAVEPMNNEQALALFKKKLGVLEDDDSVAALAAALEYMPLAIVQAAAYILQRAPRCSVKQYSEEFHRSDHEKTSLLDHEAGQLRRDREAKNSIIITWQISFEHLRRTKPSAADLLSLMSFFDRQGIPESLIHTHQETNWVREDSVGQERSIRQNLKHFLRHARKKPKAQQDQKEYNSDNRRFEDDVMALRDLCFISVMEDGATFEMHSLIQLATRRWLVANGKLEWWRKQFISNLCEAFPTGEYENWPTCQALFAHAKSALEQQPQEKSSLAEWAALLYRAASYSEMVGNVADAITLAVSSMKARKKVLGLKHEDTLRSMGMVALAYKLAGGWNVAEELEVQVMETWKKKLGADYRDTLTSMCNLASTYQNQGRWDAAEELGVQVMEASKKKLGADHPDTLISMGNLALTYRNQGRWDAAEELGVQVMETYKKKLGADHPHTLISMGNLSSTYQNQGRWNAAEELQVQVMETHKKKLGADHPDTLTSMGNLALTYRSLGRWDAAEELGVQAMETYKKTLGADHPYTLISMGNLASTYRSQGRWNAAEQLQVQVTEIHKKKLGADHPHTLTSMGNLASTLQDQGRWNEAEELEVQAMVALKKKLGADHPDTLTSMNNLALTWKKQGRTPEAIDLMQECVRLCRLVLQPTHPYSLSRSATLAQWQAEQREIS